MPVKYGNHPPIPPGTPCGGCGAQTPNPVTDHCHEHGWVRSPVCRSCNGVLAWIDRHTVPRIQDLLTVAGRCPGCFPPDPALSQDPLWGSRRDWTFLIVMVSCLMPLAWPAESAAGGWLVPVFIDSAILTCFTFALDRISKGEIGFSLRMAAAVLTGFAAWLNWLYAVPRGLTAEVFLPTMTVITYGIINAVLSDARRRYRKACDAIAEGTAS